MAREFDYFPTYDSLTDDKGYLSDMWSDFMATFVETLKTYLSENGCFIPNLTLADRDAIQEPQEGQMIYVSDSNTPITPRTAQLQIWQVVSGVGQWTVIV